MAGGARERLSACVITYNRRAIIGTCLRALAFADEVIVIDKGSTDGTLAIAGALADRVTSMPWSPTVEATRAFAIEQCTHDWLLFLDDDECLDVEAVRFIHAELMAPRADIYRFPLRHYILGRHDERAYYWPEHHVRLFRRGCVEFGETVHGGMRLLSDRIHTVPADSGPCIHHLSHRDTAQWLDKANRYTSQADRKRSLQAGSGLGRFAHQRIDHWLQHTDPCGPDDYPAAVAVLRGVYDLIDRLKGWEEEAGLDGEALFRTECARLDAAYATELADLRRPLSRIAGEGRGEGTLPPHPHPPVAPATGPSLSRDAGEGLERAVAALRESVQAQREAVDAARADLEAAHRREIEARERAAEMQRWAESEQRRAAEIEARLADFARHHDAILAEHAASDGARAAAWDTERAERQAEIASLMETGAMLGASVDDAEARAAAAESRATAAEARAAAAKIRADDFRDRAGAQTARADAAEARASAAEARAEVAEGRAAAAEAETEAAQQRSKAIEASTSWRLTAPARAVGGLLGRR